jgi:diadenosine tetraphosphate (Ap4A) HIT family hydrolase
VSQGKQSENHFEENTGFELHSQLKKDTLFFKELPLSLVLLMNDKRFPWLILVPKYIGLIEWFELPPPKQIQLWEEVNSTAKWMHQFFSADKMNIAALGNVVPQLHVHVIARYKTDVAWPKPVWGIGAAETYGDEKDKLIKEMKGSYDSFLKNV